jgi:flagellin FlaB
VRRDLDGAIGIGAMIIFIAMVLVAGMAAYVILSTSSQLEITSSQTGKETTEEVATGVQLSTIEGHNTSGLIDKIVIIITPQAGSPDIDIDNMIIELSDSSIKCVLKYSSSYWVNGTSGISDLFNANAFSPNADEFGLIVIKDADGSCTQNLPVLDRSDSVMVGLNTTACFGGIAPNVNIAGYVIPEGGSWGIIEFRTPSGFSEPVLTLQE